MRLEIPTPDDWHVHLREGWMLEHTVEQSAMHFGRVLVMPNLTPPLLTGDDAFKHREDIFAWRRFSKKSFEPFVTIKITADTTPEIIEQAYRRCAIAGKLYPEGVTTNSEDGVRNIWALAPVFKAMEDVGMVLCLHGEVPGVFCLDRETAFLSTLGALAMQYPKLRIVLEHITTKAAVKTVKGLPKNVAATITVHHLVLTLDDVVGGNIQPHNFCKPIAKSPEDREVLREAAIGGNPKFFLGTDSAPHRTSKKECASGCAGVYTAPVAMPILTHVFEEEKALDKLANFTSKYGADFYGVPAPLGTLVLEKGEPYAIKDSYLDVVPLWAGRSIAWRAERQ
jgi:dihydroorotase